MTDVMTEAGRRLLRHVDESSGWDGSMRSMFYDEIERDVLAIEAEALAFVVAAHSQCVPVEQLASAEDALRSAEMRHALHGPGVCVPVLGLRTCFDPTHAVLAATSQAPQDGCTCGANAWSGDGVCRVHPGGFEPQAILRSIFDA